MISRETDFLYTNLIDATHELEQRRRDPRLVSLVKQLLGDNIPEPLLKGPRAVLVRYIASPTLDYELFIKHVQDTNLEPLVIEYTKDKFVSKNWLKYCLGKLYFVKARPEGGIYTVGSETIINFNENEGKQLNEIRTHKGELLTDFHHRILQMHDPANPPEVFDFSQWFNENRGDEAWNYYPRYLALFLLHGILFENYLLGEEEKDFTHNIVIPAFKTLVGLTGVKPLIVRVQPPENEEEQYWLYYQEKLRTGL